MVGEKPAKPALVQFLAIVEEVGGQLARLTRRGQVGQLHGDLAGRLEHVPRGIQRPDVDDDAVVTRLAVEVGAPRAADQLDALDDKQIVDLDPLDEGLVVDPPAQHGDLPVAISQFLGALLQVKLQQVNPLVQLAHDLGFVLTPAQRQSGEDRRQTPVPSTRGWCCSFPMHGDGYTRFRCGLHGRAPQRAPRLVKE